MVFFVVATGIVIQGESEDELPERVICCVTMNHIDFQQLSPLTKHYVDYVNRFLRDELPRS